MCQSLEVVANRHHRHRKTCPCLDDGTDQFATHLRDAREDVFHPRPDLGDAGVELLLPRAQGAVACTLALNLVAAPRAFNFAARSVLG